MGHSGEHSGVERSACAEPRLSRQAAPPQQEPSRGRAGWQGSLWEVLAGMSRSSALFRLAQWAASRPQPQMLNQSLPRQEECKPVNHPLPSGPSAPWDFRNPLVFHAPGP